MKVNRTVELTLWERIYLPEILKGMSITTRHFINNLIGFIPSFFGKKRRIMTVYYPEERVVFPDAYRGRPLLVADKSGKEKCVACGLCEFVCPPQCIKITPGFDPADIDRRFPISFSIDMSVCIFCGFCEEACPKEAIVMSSEYDITGYDRYKMLYTKDQLLRSEENLNKRLGYIRKVFGRWNY